MSKIFISYRRDDSRWATALIYQHLVTRFTKEQVFMDTDIPPGADFVNVITETARKCKILIVIIGDKWLSISDSKGNRRLDNHDDFVRLEIATALKHKALVVPVLIDGVKMPQEEELPNNIAALARRNAFTLNHIRFAIEIELFTRSLETALPELLHNVEISSKRAIAEKRIQEAFNSLEYESLNEFLKWKYQHDTFLEKCGRTYPVITFQAPQDQWYEVNSLLDSPLRLDTDQVHLTHDDTYRSNIGILGNAPLINRPTYTMINFGTEDQLNLKCGLGDYFSYLDTCRSLEWELLTNWYDVHPKPRSTTEFAEFDKKLVLRNKLHSYTQDVIRVGLGRSAAIGIITLLAFTDEQRDYYLLVTKRSKNVAIDPDILVAVPSGMFQPVTQEPSREFLEGGVIANIYLE
jgi:hypothetical protein